MSFRVAHNSRSVFAPVTALFFQSGQLDECRAFLANRAAHTECVPVVDESQLAMRGDGRLVESGYRFNPLGFEALCRALSGGLVTIFNELAGEVSRRLPDRDSHADDIAAAVSIYNTALRVRFEVLRERTLLVNHQERAIEGFLGLDHRMLDNTEFFDIVAAALQDKQRHAEFYRAEIVGRELRLYFIDANSRREALHPDPRHTFAAGWYFSNREDVGQAVKGALCVYTRFGVAFEPTTTKTKVVHAGADLLGRTTAMATRVASRNVDMDALAAQMRKLLSMSLNFSDKKSDHDKAVRYWTNYLCKFKIKTDTAASIVKNAMTAGSDLKLRQPLEVYSRPVLASRNVYDLACSVLRIAKTEYAMYRDILQGAAMRMLVPEKEEGWNAR
ncbi:hypothetical protein EBZ39_04545 [bacterium]|nr:hypothetical protein [bacterium]